MTAKTKESAPLHSPSSSFDPDVGIAMGSVSRPPTGVKASRSSPNSLRVVLLASIMILSSMYMNVTLDLKRVADKLRASEAFHAEAGGTTRRGLLQTNGTQKLEMRLESGAHLRDPDDATAAASTERRKPQVALFLTYPNSGTSYTITNSWRMTNMSTATTHGQEVKTRIPVRPDLFEAPFLARPDLQVPDLVLTKSHCTGFCLHCRPASVGKFQEACLTGSWSDSRFHKRRFRLGIVGRALHLVRSPLDNCVSRLHHALHTHDKLGLSPETLDRLSNTETGLSAWCDYIDHEFRYLIPPAIARRPDIDRLKAIPCYSEFMRQVLWHNAALNMTSRIGKPVLTMFYENYTTNFDGATRELYNFLEQPIVGRPLPFVSGKSYHHLFNQSHVAEIAYLMRSLASDDTWELLRHYFESPSPHLAEPLQSTSQRQQVMETSYANGISSQYAQGHLRGVTQAHDFVTQDKENGILAKQRGLQKATETEASKVAWLLSFPNSGTSYTIMNLQRVTNTSAASNYGKEVIGDLLLRVRPDVENSPFILHPERRVPPIVLTKTHCTAYCATCRTLAVTQEAFERGCSESHLDPTARSIYNASALVGKAAHLFRDPFANLVSRKHLGVQVESRDHPELFDQLTAMQQDTPEALLAWCQYMDDHVIENAIGWYDLDADIRSQFWVVPCASDLFRMVQWHNLAIETTGKLNIPVHYLHYEDYEHFFEETVMNLLGFLELPLTSSGFRNKVPFEGGKSYHHLINETLATSMVRFIRRIATPETWRHLKRYFEPSMIAATEGMQS